MKVSARGFTLVEIIVSVAVSMVLVTSTAAVFIAVSKAKSEASRKAQIANSGAGSTSMLEFDATNAGFHFSSLPFSVSVSNNFVDSASTEPTQHDECGLPDLERVPHSDSVEFSMGYEGSAGQVFSESSPFGGTLSGFKATLTNFAPLDGVPLFNATGSTKRPILLFKRKGLSCMASIDSWDPSTRQIVGKRLNRDFSLVDPNSQLAMWGFGASSWTFDSSVLNNQSACPQAGMEVFKLQERIKYVLCDDKTPPMPSSGKWPRVLVRRRMVASGNGFTPFEPSATPFVGSYRIAQFHSCPSCAPPTFYGPDEGTSQPAQLVRDGLVQFEIAVKIVYPYVYSNQFSGVYGTISNGIVPGNCDNRTCWCNAMLFMGAPLACPGRDPAAGANATNRQNAFRGTIDSLQNYFPDSLPSGNPGEYDTTTGGGALKFDGSLSGGTTFNAIPPWFAAYRFDDATWPRGLKFQLTYQKPSETNESVVKTSLDYAFSTSELSNVKLVNTESTLRLMSGFVE